MRNNTQSWNIENSYIKLPSTLFSKQLPEKCINPKKVCFNLDLALDLGLKSFSDSEILDYFSGNKIPKGSIPISQAYAGHQFGHYTMLGDGRAILLGEQISPENIRYDVQLKGSGKTPYSRRGDGNATLSSVLREYLMSEAMYFLGIPSTRSLAVLKTGKKVFREKVHDGGVLTRIALSHIRFGTFEFVRNYCSKDEFKIFINYVINRHFPQIKKNKNPILELFELVMIKQIELIVNWMRVGFIHGVMNTDNMSIVGETIDYGPCSFMNKYDPETVFSSIDRMGRYSFGNQPKIIYTNLVIFANTLIPMVSDNEEKSVALLKEKLDKFSSLFSNNWYKMMYKKLGILDPVDKDRVIVDSLLKLMNIHEADYTNTFAALTLNTESKDEMFKLDEFIEWKKLWKNRINIKDTNIEIMKMHNPLVIPRNYLVEFALEDAVDGNLNKFNDLLDLLSKPYNYKTNFELQKPPKGFDQSYKTYCGT